MLLSKFPTYQHCIFQFFFLIKKKSAASIYNCQWLNKKKRKPINLNFKEKRKNLLRKSINKLVLCVQKKMSGNRRNKFSISVGCRNHVIKMWITLSEKKNVWQNNEKNEKKIDSIQSLQHSLSLEWNGMKNKEFRNSNFLFCQYGSFTFIFFPYFFAYKTTATTKKILNFKQFRI